MRQSKVVKIASLCGGVAVAVSSLMATPVMAGGHGGKKMAEHGPKVYGRVDLGIMSQDMDNGTTSEDAWKIESFASRLGFKGKEKLTDSMSVVYKYELEIDPEEQSVGNSSSSSFLKARDQYVGLKGGFGKLRIGRMDTPLKKSQGKVDLFSDHPADLKYVMEGDNRLGDTINYTTPTKSNVTGQIALIQGEGESDLDADGTNDDGLGDAISASVVYSANGLYLAGAIDSDVDAQDTWRLTAQHKVDKMTYGILYQTAEGNGTSPNEETAFLLSFSYDLDGTVFKAQYAASDTENSAGVTQKEESNLAFGVWKKYSKSTTIFAELVDFTLETPGAADQDTFTFVTGVRKKF